MDGRDARSANGRRSLRIAALIAAKDVRQRLRDGSALVLSVIVPLGLALIFSQLIGPGARFHASYAVVDLDSGPLGTAFREQALGGLVAAGVADVLDVPTEAAAREAVGAGVDAAVIIPQGFSQAIETGQATSLQVVGAADRALAVELARAVARRFGDEVSIVGLSVATVTALAGTPDDAGRAAIAAAASASPAAALVDVVARSRQLDQATFYSAAMAAMFLFFAAQLGLVSVHEERRAGTLGRILAGPVAPWTVVAGKLAGAFAISTLTMAILVVATSLLIGADWGAPAGVAALSLGLIVAAIGISAAVTSFASSASVAAAAGSSAAIALAILGGSFAPTAHGPAFLSALALLTPHGWFLRGLADLHGRGATIADALPAVLVLLAMGLATGAIGTLRARRLVTAR
jgi:linearmycin/streptolysin S transport system permease protein